MHPSYNEYLHNIQWRGLQLPFLYAKLKDTNIYKQMFMCLNK